MAPLLKTYYIYNMYIYILYIISNFFIHFTWKCHHLSQYGLKGINFCFVGHSGRYWTSHRFNFKVQLNWSPLRHQHQLLDRGDEVEGFVWVECLRWMSGVEVKKSFGGGQIIQETYATFLQTVWFDEFCQLSSYGLVNLSIWSSSLLLLLSWLPLLHYCCHYHCDHYD